MGRIVNVDSPSKIRNQLMRTSAELLRHLSQKAELDEDARDMASQLVFCLRGIEEGIETSAMAWEKRDYWVKAEQLRHRWAWAGLAATRLENVIRDGAWNQLPEVLAELFPYFTDIKINRFTREPSEWAGAYETLLREMSH